MHLSPHTTGGLKSDTLMQKTLSIYDLSYGHYWRSAYDYKDFTPETPDLIIHSENAE